MFLFSSSHGLLLRFLVFWSGRLIKIAGGHLTIPFQIGSDCKCAGFLILFSIYSRWWFVSKRGKLRKLHCRQGGYYIRVVNKVLEGKWHLAVLHFN